MNRPDKSQFADAQVSDFYEHLKSIKDANLDKLRTTSLQGQVPYNVVAPRISNPDKMADAREEIMYNKIAMSERKDAWAKWRAKRDGEKGEQFAFYGIAAFLAYKFLF